MDLYLVTKKIYITNIKSFTKKSAQFKIHNQISKFY